MPSRNGAILQLSHTLSYHVQGGTSVPTNLYIVNEVFNNPRAMRIPHYCPLAKIRPLVGRYVLPEVVAVRVPLLHLSNFQINDWPDLSAKSYAIMELREICKFYIFCCLVICDGTLTYLLFDLNY